MTTQIRTLIISLILSTSSLQASGLSGIGIQSIVKIVHTLSNRKHVNFPQAKRQDPFIPKVQAISPMVRETGNALPKNPVVKLDSHNSYAVHESTYFDRRAKMNAWLNAKNTDPKQEAALKAMFDPRTMTKGL